MKAIPTRHLPHSFSPGDSVQFVLQQRQRFSKTASSAVLTTWETRSARSRAALLAASCAAASSAFFLACDFTAAFGTAGAGFGTGAAELPGLSAGLFSSELELLELSLDEGSSLTTVFGRDAGKAATFPSFSFFCQMSRWRLPRHSSSLCCADATHAFHAPPSSSLCCGNATCALHASLSWQPSSLPCRANAKHAFREPDCPPSSSSCCANASCQTFSSPCCANAAHASHAPATLRVAFSDGHGTCCACASFPEQLSTPQAHRRDPRHAFLGYPLLLCGCGVASHADPRHGASYDDGDAATSLMPLLSWVVLEAQGEVGSYPAPQQGPAAVRTRPHALPSRHAVLLPTTACHAGSNTSGSNSTGTLRAVGVRTPRVTQAGHTIDTGHGLLPSCWPCTLHGSWSCCEVVGQLAPTAPLTGQPLLSPAPQLHSQQPAACPARIAPGPQAGRPLPQTPLVCGKTLRNSNAHGWPGRGRRSIYIYIYNIYIVLSDYIYVEVRLYFSNIRLTTPASSAARRLASCTAHTQVHHFSCP